MSIYRNAIDSIELGVQDYVSSDQDKRRILSATRNIVAGILLLIKHKMLESDASGSETIIRQRISPHINAQGNIEWIGEGSKTVDYQQIQERCNSLGIKFDKPRLDKIISYRNNIEHYYDNQNTNGPELVANAMAIIHLFMRDELGLDPQAEFSEDIWTALVDNSEIFEAERASCVASIKEVDWKFKQVEDAMLNWQCPACGSSLIAISDTTLDRLDAKPYCRNCREEHDMESAIEDAIESYFWTDNFLAMKDGGNPAIISCAVCNQDAYDLAEGCCLICEESMPDTCIRCGETIPPEEMDGSEMCGYCNHMCSKDD